MQKHVCQQITTNLQSQIKIEAISTKQDAFDAKIKKYKSPIALKNSSGLE